ncbi:MAG: hypothetical protein EKK45_01155 [Curvibacter sp.]|nr:MAG: hypothetical protein EKK45_01155 [Curvibacter sp.]
MKFAPTNSGRKSLRVTLGDGWRRFAMPQHDVEFMGVAQRGMEIGALARDVVSGMYVLVNGDLRQALNTSKVESALRSASKAATSRSSTSRATLPSQPVVVVVKPRRRILSID